MLFCFCNVPAFLRRNPEKQRKGAAARMSPENGVLLAEHIGNRIRFYRLRRNMSQEQLAARIFKSKSTLSKYESGQISMDVDTLFRVACALEVEMSQLVDYSVPVAAREPAAGSNSFHLAASMYMYYYDGRSNKVTRTLLQFDHSHRSDNSIPCLCYMDVPSFEDYQNCRYFYTGIVLLHEMVSYIILNNPFNHTERIFISMLNPFQPTQNIRGIMLALSFNPITPCAVKCLMSPKELPGAMLRKEDLVLSRDDLKEFKKLNMLLLNTDTA